MEDKIMANLTVRFFSESLQRPTTFKMFIPNDRRIFPRMEVPSEDEPMKTIFLLHGYTGDGESWVPEWLAEKYNIAVVCPSGENGFWLDGMATGHKFQTFLGEELVKYVRKTFGLAMVPELTYTMGLSMGGFGALHTALAYPETFGKCFAMSSALIVHGIAHMKEGESNPVANYAYYHECFGDLETVLESDNNPETLVKKLKAAGAKLPEIYMACGTEDFLIEPNREFHRFLEEQGVEHVYCESKGIHDMIFWSEYVQKFIEMVWGK